MGWGLFFKGIGSKAESAAMGRMRHAPPTPSHTRDPEVECELSCSLVSTVPRIFWTLELCSFWIFRPPKSQKKVLTWSIF